MRDIKFIQSDQRMLVINSTSSGKQHSSHSATRAQVSLIHPHLFWQSEWHVMTAGAWPLSSFTPDCHRSSGSLESQRARQPSPQHPPPSPLPFSCSVFSTEVGLAPAAATVTEGNGNSCSGGDGGGKSSKYWGFLQTPGNSTLPVRSLVLNCLIRLTFSTTEQFKRLQSSHALSVCRVWASTLGINIQITGG